MEVYSTKDTVTSKKSFNEASKIESILLGIDNNNKALNENVILTEEIERDSMFNLASSHDSRNRQKRMLKVEHAKFFQENFGELLEHYLFNVVNKALLIDEDVKEVNKEYMVQQVSKVTEHLIHTGAFNEPASATMKSVIESIAVHIESMFKVKNSEEKVKEIRESYLSDVNSYINYVSEAVRTKVTDVVKFEKNFATAISESEEIMNRKGMRDSVFKVIHLENVKGAMLQENTSEPTDVVMNMALAETLFDYTLLETINTLRIVEFDADQLRNGVARFFKN